MSQSYFQDSYCKVEIFLTIHGSFLRLYFDFYMKLWSNQWFFIRISYHISVIFTLNRRNIELKTKKWFFLQGFLQILPNLDGKFCYMQNKMFCIYKTFSFKIFFKPFIYPNSKNICNNIQNFMIRIPLNLDVALTVRIWL